MPQRRDYERIFYGWTIFRPCYPFTRHYLVREWATMPPELLIVGWDATWELRDDFGDGVLTAHRLFGCLCDTIHEAREALPKDRGWYLMPPNPEDDQAIAEVYI